MSFEIKVAKTAGFCFGVRRAVEIAEKEAAKHGGCTTLGPLIHNEAEIARLNGLGIMTADSPDGAKGTLIIRSHGVPARVTDYIEEKGYPYIDATCPFVKKIHGIVAKAEGYVIIAGDAAHPEVEGIIGHCSDPGKVTAVQSADELEDLLKQMKTVGQNALTMVAQTTFNSAKWKSFQEIARKHYTNISIFDTICSATAERQEEAERLSAEASLMIVAGGKNSSNTQKLAQICQKHCPVLFVQRGSDIDKAAVRLLLTEEKGGGTRNIGITAGASTPAYIIKEVHSIMSEIIKDEDIDFMAEVDKTFKKVYIGNRVKAYVVAVNSNEAVVDLGTKHSGYIPADELSQNPNDKPEDVVKVGDEIDAIVTSINDAEGVVTLSKKRVDSVLGVEKMSAAMEANETVEGDVTAVVKGGIIVAANGTRVFIPASQTGVPREGKLDNLLKTKVRFKVIEVTEARGRVVGSIRMVNKEERDAKRAAFWENIEVGQKFTGEVKSIESYGVFVDLGGVDGMVHSSELTWSRIKHPKEIVNIGDKLDVFVKSFDPDKKRVSLGCKKDEDNPWLKFEQEYAEGDVIDAKVVSITPFGAFAQIIPGVDGLIHISQVSNERINNVAQVLTVGDEVKVKIIEINSEANRISLSIRVLLEDAPVEDAPEEEAAEEAAVEEAPAEVAEEEAPKPKRTRKKKEEEAPAEEAPAEEAAEAAEEEAPKPKRTRKKKEEAPVEEAPAEEATEE
ncbi:MAG: bifunctional 4-hydroxy-3-methylbut-2-enyl diphosphate reductase/30S ribosomal protein S1 [Eubacterium sp.]|nr:bifunctional 4-hydroxy-3-methylbut-2-enyl diphosphate reductase/30S ribosomal protein S1 [Eubacterium sp.]